MHRLAVLPRHAPVGLQLGIGPLERLIAGKRSQEETGVELPFVVGHAPMMGPEQGKQMEVVHLLLQCTLQLARQAARLVAQALFRALSFTLLQALAQPVAGHEQDQEQAAESEIGEQCRLRPAHGVGSDGVSPV
ncbi:hypothetical protein D9M71_189870 [compost metagenome]